MAPPRRRWSRPDRHPPEGSLESAVLSTDGILRPASVCGVLTQYPARMSRAAIPGKATLGRLAVGPTWITALMTRVEDGLWGVGNPAPYDSAPRPGDNLYTCSVLALDPKTGKIKWHYQFSPNNPFDYDAVAEMVLADIKIDGKLTKVLMDANRNGFFYVLDRTKGKLLAANPLCKSKLGFQHRHEDRTPGRDRRQQGCARGQEGRGVSLGSGGARTGSRCRSARYLASLTPYAGLRRARYKTVPATYKAGEWYLGHGSDGSV